MKAGWEIKKLGEVCDFEGGSQPPKSNFIYEPRDGYIRFLQIRDFGTEKHATFIPKSKKNRQCSADDILIGRYGASVGKILTGKAGAYNVALMRTEPDLRLLNKGWFHNYLLSNHFQQSLMKVADRSAQNGFSKDDIYNFPVPIPPLSEQAHIVGILDEAFASIATAKANTQKNLENAKAVFESHLNSVFSQRGEGWVEKKLGEVCEFQNGFAFKSNTFKPSGTPVLRISNIQGGVIDEDDVVFIDPSDYREDLERYRIVKGDLLIAMSGATTGKIGFNTLETEFFLNQRVGKFEPKLPLNKRFLYYYLSTKVEENLRISAGSAQPNLSTEQIKGFLLPIPSMEHQKQLVHDFDVIAEETSRLTSLYTQKLSALEDLKKSLLHQAFTGKL
jgi:type I restriction enzyme S subunit